MLSEPQDGAAPARQRRGPVKLDCQAQQTLELRSQSGTDILGLVGKLQGVGFLVVGLDWQLSPQVSRKAHDEAMVKTFQALRGRAAAAAAALELRVERFQDVGVDEPSVYPIRPMMAVRAKPIAPPQVAQSAQMVTSQVSADVVL